MSSWPLRIIRGEMGIHLQVKILRAIMGKYPQHWLAKSCMDHFGRTKLRTYRKLICLSPFTPASENKDDLWHDILAVVIAVCTRHRNIQIALCWNQSMAEKWKKSLWKMRSNANRQDRTILYPLFCCIFNPVTVNFQPKNKQNIAGKKLVRIQWFPMSSQGQIKSQVVLGSSLNPPCQGYDVTYNPQMYDECIYILTVGMWM